MYPNCVDPSYRALFLDNFYTRVEYFGKLLIAAGSWLQGQSHKVVWRGKPLVVRHTGRLVLSRGVQGRNIFCFQLIA
jgi:hypothetical protein